MGTVLTGYLRGSSVNLKDQGILSVFLRDQRAFLKDFLIFSETLKDFMTQRKDLRK